MPKKKQQKRRRASTKDFMGITRLGGHSIETEHGELVFFVIDPTNLSTLSNSNIEARVFSLMNFLKGFSDIEFLCLNSRENYEENKHFLRRRLEEEPVPELRALLEKDLVYLDRIQVQMATAREFLIVVRLKDMKPAEATSHLTRVEKSLKDQGFNVRKTDEQEYKRLLGVYFEQNVTTERFEDYDGDRFVLDQK